MSTAVEIGMMHEEGKMLNASYKSHTIHKLNILRTALDLAAKTITQLSSYFSLMRNNCPSQHFCTFLSSTDWSWDRWHNFLKQNTTVEPGTNPDVLIFNAGIIPDFVLSFSAEDRCYKNNLHCFSFIFWISEEWSFSFGKWNQYNIILKINPAIEIILGRRNPNLLFCTGDELKFQKKQISAKQ